MTIDKKIRFTTMYLDIVDFHSKFGLKQYTGFSGMPEELVKFREKFIMEECKELYDSSAQRNHEEALDALVDISYIALGTIYMMGADLLWLNHQGGDVPLLQLLKYADKFELNSQSAQHLADMVYSCRTIALTMNWNFDEAWKIVHAANMKKVRVERASDSKRGSTFDVKKPIGWIKPDLSGCV